MSEHSPLIHDTANGISTITFNRPEKHNAFDDQLIADLTTLLQRIDKNADVRAVILKANGRNFCAGADLTWMKRMASFSKEENKADALQLAKLLHIMSALTKPIIALVQGRVMGGGLGLLACCDIVIAAEDARFCFSEVKLGLIPATIAPYIIRSIGFSAARRYFISAEMFDAQTAQQIGLVHELAPESTLISAGNDCVDLIMQNGPAAIAASKQMLNHLAIIDDSTIEYTATLLSEIRSGHEGQDGVRAFLEKRQPKWIEDER
ncbi:enoyl-CoA hydratase/isomerase family protein [Candidiatus Paracoxiella cheracis]|uniref:enoyl-CoA hydratase/isomerase family protein n=1 Tax=Candidiatus Paracoxiella cheracis TaxID=3405120 RepID=UPI003BF599BA